MERQAIISTAHVLYLEDATGGKSHGALIEVPIVSNAPESKPAEPLDLSPPPSPEPEPPIENGSSHDVEDGQQGEGGGPIPNGGNYCVSFSIIIDDQLSHLHS